MNREEIENLIIDLEDYEKNFQNRKMIDFTDLMKRIMVVQIEWLKKIVKDA
jgi:hypothetical protein